MAPSFYRHDRKHQRILSTALPGEHEGADDDEREGGLLSPRSFKSKITRGSVFASFGAAGRSKSIYCPLATENLLENADGVGAPPLEHRSSVLSGQQPAAFRLC